MSFISQHVWTHARISARPGASAPLTDAALVVQDGAIAWLGPSAQLPERYRAWPATDVAQRWITPGLVDCHTHLVFGGNRADEFAQRLAGASYAEIARAGGGIAASVRATRAASESALLEQAWPRLNSLLADGVSAVEIKSGYGLDLASERKILRVARRLGELARVEVRTTFLGAHALPPEYQGRADAYIDDLCTRVLPSLHDEGLVDAVDVFCENIAFDVAQCARMFDAAARLGLPVKAHAEQLSLSGASVLVADYRGLSADHLEHLDQAGVLALRAAGTVAVLLPAAYYFLRETQAPPIDLLRRHGVPMAVASDCNPGTAPTASLLLSMNMAATEFRLTVDEVLAGVSGHAAAALGIAARQGELAPGRAANFAVWQVESLAELVYWIGGRRLWQVVRQGHRYDGAGEVDL
jgi:imidazolonepropionase